MLVVVVRRLQCNHSHSATLTKSPGGDEDGLVKHERRQRARQVRFRTFMMIHWSKVRSAVAVRDLGLGMRHMFRR